VTPTGTLVLVVGPSGAGKDSVIAGTAAALQDDPRYVFARRMITRPATAGGEYHLPLTTEDFATRRAAGQFLLDWHAHGFDYGLPIALAEDLAAGCTVVANVSRSVIAAARARWPTRLVLVTAAPEVLAERLARRGREDAPAIRARLARTTEMPVAAEATIVNDGNLVTAIDTFVALLRGNAGQAAGCADSG
jgi:ribose 1,5-bisphosphokinase